MPMIIVDKKMEVVALEKDEDNVGEVVVVAQEGPMQDDDGRTLFVKNSITFRCDKDYAPSIGSMLQILVSKAE